ncbi:MAG: hypothetical protein NTW21_37145, partial [Verrucomicrobia bacterium]|nr:hypothetical protein [Verrucomicrobiota bacterium]
MSVAGPLPTFATELRFDPPGNLVEVRAAVTGLPVITAQPMDVLAQPGSTASFFVAVGNRAGASFQWRKNSTNIGGAISDVLTIASAGTADEASYEVVITNPSGSVTSAAAHLWLDSDGDGMADAKELQFFGWLDQEASGDADGDGITNEAELADGTNPANASEAFVQLAVVASGGSVVVFPASSTGRYAVGTAITLTAVPEPKFRFVEWQGSLSGSASPAQVVMDSDKSVFALFGSPLAEALDLPALDWQTGGTGPWLGQQSVSHDGVDAAQSAALSAAGTSWVSTYANGPATVKFWWKLSTGSVSSLKLFVDDTQSAAATAGADWTEVTVSLTGGSHLLLWKLERTAGTSGADQAWLDQVRISTVGTVPLAEALDATDLPWSTDPVHPWFGATDTTHDGVDAARSGPGGSMQESWVETVVAGSATLGFWWKVSGASLELWMDGTRQDVISGEVDWQAKQYLIGSGSHVIRWRYIKAESASGGDAGWLDQVVSSHPGIHPEITSTAPASGAVGLAYNHTCAAVGSPAPTFSATGLPSGLTISSGGVISGTPSATGTFNGTITAANGTQANATQAFSITIFPGGLTHTFASATEVALTAAHYTASGVLNLTLGFAPPTGTNLTVVNSTGLAFINGTFDNLAQGQAVSLTFGGITYDFVANYYGGSGNDLVLVWANNRAFAWGSNYSGQLGDNSTLSRATATSVTASGVLAGKMVVAVSAGYRHSLALCSDGTVAAWGFNGSGQLGDNATTSRTVPVAVNTASGVSALFGKTVVAVSAGGDHSMALCSDGTVAAWGSNAFGKLGDNTTTSRTVPVAVNTASGVSALFGRTVVAVSAGGDHSMALCSDGTVATWGCNGYGALGDNTVTQRL